MPQSRLQTLKRDIEQAFADVPYPGDDRIAYSNVDWEGSQLAAAFKGKHWKALALQELQFHNANFLSREGYRYYLPAYLLAALDDYGNLLPLTVLGLRLPDAHELRQGRLERFEAFSPMEKHAIRSFLEYARDSLTDYFPGGNVPREALERYWGQD